MALPGLLPGGQAPAHLSAVSPHIYIFRWIFYHKSLSPLFSIIAMDFYGF